MKIIDKISFSKLSDPLRSKEQLRGMGPGYDRSLVSLQATDGFAWKTLIGPEPTFSATGPLVDDLGNPTTNPVQSRGLMAMGAWTQMLPVEMSDSINSANSSVSVVNGVTAISETAATAARYITAIPSLSFISGLSYTMSRKVKFVGRRYIQLTGSSASFGSGQYANFDLQLGTVAYSVGCLATITPEADGYYTIRMTAVATATISSGSCIIASIEAGNSVRTPTIPGINGIAYYTKHAMCVQSAYLYPYGPPGITVPASSSTTGGNGTNTALDERTAAALSSAAFTAIASIIPGASSSQVTADANVLSVRGVVADLIYLASGGTIKSSDGTNVASVTVTDGWLATDVLHIFVRTNAAGTQFQIGYQKNGVGAITWGLLATYKNTMTPGTHLRKALNVAMPMFFKESVVSKKSLSDSSCLLLKRYIR